MPALLRTLFPLTLFPLRILDPELLRRPLEVLLRIPVLLRRLLPLRTLNPPPEPLPR